jgi:acyl-CoA hydrolase
VTRTSLALSLLLVAPLWAADPPLNLTHTTSFVVFPADANANAPMLFGGKLLAEMDRAAGVAARRLLYASAVRDAVTAGLSVEFHKPGRVKDLVFVTATVAELGEKSIRIAVRAERETAAGRELLAEGKFVFVAYSLEEGRAVPHGLSLPASPAGVGR